MVRKREPGGGRKPAGPFIGKSANFSTRLTPELRRELETLANEMGQSISQVSEMLMRAGILALRKGIVVNHPAKLELKE